MLIKVNKKNECFQSATYSESEFEWQENLENWRRKRNSALIKKDFLEENNAENLKKLENEADNIIENFNMNSECQKLFIENEKKENQQIINNISNKVIFPIIYFDKIY